MNKKSISLLIIGCLLTGSVDALTIDAFNTGLVQFPGVWAQGPTGSSAATQTGSMLGGSRTIALQMLEGGGFTSNTVYFDSVKKWHVLAIDNGDARSLVTVTWRSAPGVDLTDGGASRGFFLGIPSPNDHPLDVTIRVQSATGISEARTLFPTTSSGDDFYIPFSSFSAGANFLDASQISLGLSSPDRQLDTQITLFATTTVPVPGTLPLIGIGLLGLAWGTWRARA